MLPYIHMGIFVVTLPSDIALFQLTLDRKLTESPESFDEEK